VDLVACVGDDAYGTAVVADLERAGVGTTHVRAVRGARTGTATVAVDPRGENLIVVDLGANALLDPDDAGAAVSRAAVTLVQLEVGDDVVDAAIRSSPGVVVLNPAPARALRADLLAHVDVVVPNRVELALLAGQEAGPRTPAQAAAMARALPGTFDVVVSMGADGAVVVERRANVAVHVVAPTVDAVDTTGAGDVLCGVLAASLAGGHPLADAVRCGVVAASVSTTTPGARAAPASGTALRARAASLTVRDLPGP